MMIIPMDTLRPVVPTELEPLMNDRFMENHEEWQAKSWDDLKGDMPRATSFRTGDEFTRAVVLGPENPGDIGIALALPHQQAWKPSMFIRAEYMRQQFDPAARMVVFPNETLGSDYNDYSKKELNVISQGNWEPLAARRMSILEQTGVERYVSTGYSLGGLQALALGSIASDKVLVELINADEAPLHERTAKQLRKDFMKSGGWGGQRQAIADAKLPVLEEVLSVPKLAADYARFGAASLKAVSKAMHEGMAHDATELMAKIESSYPAARIKLGAVAGSLLVDPSIDARRIYSGNGAHGHATGDNVVAHWLMFDDTART